jgi:DNA-binding CsgD family transcriptional regulator
VAASALSHPTIALLTEIEGDRSRVVAALQEAADARVIYIEDERIRFSHPLLGSVIYASGTSSGRHAFHARLARVVTDPEDRARHLAIAVHGADEEAASACEEGARTAWARAAPHSAAHLAVRALELTPPPETEALLRRSLAAAQYLYDSGDTELARQLIRTRVATLPAGPDRARALYRLAVVEGELGPARDSIRLFEQALTESSADSALAVRIAIDLAWMESWGGSVVTAAAHAHEALRMAEALKKEDLIGQAQVAVAVLDNLCGRPARDDLMKRAIELEPQMSEVALDRAPSAAYGLQLTRRGYLDAARPLFEHVLQLAVERGEETNLSAMSFYLSGLEWLAGNWQKAEEHIDRGTELAALTGVNRQEMLYTDATLVAYRGRLDEARVKAEQGLATARGSAEPLAMSRFLATLGFIELTRGRHENARNFLVEARETLLAMGLQEPGSFRFLPDLVEACLATGATSEAREITAWLEDRAHPVDQPWAAAAGARCRGMVQFAEAEAERATRSLTEAMDRYSELPMPFEVGRSALILGQGQRRLKLKRGARDSLQHALDIFEELGARAWAERARSELGRIGGRPSTPYELTPSEREVATLVASGRSNREVAETLHMTVNTVETNLSRIYRKLAVRSRSELGATLRAGRNTSNGAGH